MSTSFSVHPSIHPSTCVCVCVANRSNSHHTHHHGGGGQFYPDYEAYRGEGKGGSLHQIWNTLGMYVLLLQGGKNGIAWLVGWLFLASCFFFPPREFETPPGLIQDTRLHAYTHHMASHQTTLHTATDGIQPIKPPCCMHPHVATDLSNHHAARHAYMHKSTKSPRLPRQAGCTTPPSQWCTWPWPGSSASTRTSKYVVMWSS